MERGMGGGADHDHGMTVDGGMFMPETKKKNMMHMTFFWGKDVDMLFSGWPGRSLGMYLLALFFVFALAVMVEWLSHSRFFKQGSNRVVSGLAKTFLHAVRMGLAYLVMLAVMSFNVGVLIAAIIGHAIGFFIFGSRIFSRNDAEMAELNPGPLDRSILQEQDCHISEVIWSGREVGPLICKPATILSDKWSLNATQEAYVQETGLLHLSKLQKITIDHALISALVERWRPETNTFHLASGEATVTLEDVAYIYGLPINGRVVTGRTFSSPTTVSEVCLELLGKQPQQGSDCNGSDLKLTWLVKSFSKLSKKSSKNEQIRATRAYLFCLVAGQIFTNTSGSMGGAWILELFREFKKYAWGPACLANLYRQLSIRTVAKSTGKHKGSKKPSDHQKTFGGPVQLLQIWAISRMSIGREIKSAQQWDDHFEFPLSRLWSRRLKSHKTFSTVEVVRKQLDNQDPDNFIWRPYVGFEEELANIVDEEEMEVFSSQTVVVCYWIVERHNSNRVMKQFGLQQIIPPPLYGAFNREDRVLKATVDYSKKMQEGIKEWNDRKKSVLEGEVDVDSMRHSDEYFQWYRGITRLRIGRFEVVESATNPDLEQGHNHTQQDPGPSQSHPQTNLSDSTMMEIGDFASHLLLGVENMKKQPDKEIKIDEFLDRISRKIMRFKSACASRFVEFKMQDCISSSSDEEERKRPKKHPDIGSSQMTPSNVPLEMTMYPIPPSPIHVDSISSQPVEDVLSSPSGFFTPPRPVFTQESVVELSPGESLPSKIIRIKARYRKNTLPVRFRPYQVTTYGARSAEYSLTLEEAAVLDIFWNEYKANDPSLAKFCTVIPASKLHKFLRNEWLDTKAMDYWFEILATKVRGAHFFHASLAEWYRDPNTHSDIYHNSFGSPERRYRYSFSSRDWLVFPMCTDNHFHLLVGNVKLGRWEYYNSLNGFVDNQFLECFTTFVASRLRDDGWSNPFSWKLVRIPDLPQQVNGHDCGFFTLAYVEHIVTGRPMNFNQQDMWYYRAKVVHDMYLQQMAPLQHQFSQGH